MAQDGSACRVRELWHNRKANFFYNNWLIREGHIYGCDGGFLNVLRVDNGLTCWRSRGAQESKRFCSLFHTQSSMLFRIKWLRVLVEHDVSGQFCLLCVRCIFHGSLRLVDWRGVTEMAKADNRKTGKECSCCRCFIIPGSHARRDDL